MLNRQYFPIWKPQVNRISGCTKMHEQGIDCRGCMILFPSGHETDTGYNWRYLFSEF